VLSFHLGDHITSQGTFVGATIGQLWNFSLVARHALQVLFESFVNQNSPCCCYMAVSTVGGRRSIAHQNNNNVLSSVGMHL
jgi:hypothetical protein